MAELFYHRRDPELLQGGNPGWNQAKDRAVTVRLLQEIAAEPRPLIHLVGKVEIAALLEQLPALSATDLAQHSGRFLACNGLCPNRHHIAMPSHLRRLSFADMQIGAALLRNDTEELVDVRHIKERRFTNRRPNKSGGL